MEFHNAKLLPPGLHEIIVAFVPYDIYPETKVIAYPGKVERRSHLVLGEAVWDKLTSSFVIWLYPLEIVKGVARVIDGQAPFPPFGCVCSVRRIRSERELCFRCQLWADFTCVALHEIAHLATFKLHHDYWRVPKKTPYENYLHTEILANDWFQAAVDKTVKVYPHLGRPSKALASAVGRWFYANLAPLIIVHDGNPTRWQFIEGNWELRETDSIERVPAEQLRLEL